MKRSFRIRTLATPLNCRFLHQLPTPELSIQFSAATANYLVAIYSQPSSIAISRDSLKSQILLM
jgi:hypothetical protein